MVNAQQAKAYRMMQYGASASSVLGAGIIYFLFPDIPMAPLIAGILVIVAIGEWFIFRALADKAER